LKRTIDISTNIDWPLVILFGIFIFAGWLNIFAANYSGEETFEFSDLFDLGTNAGKQLLFIGLVCSIVISIFIIDYRFFETFSYISWGVFVFLLVIVMLFAREVNGARSWLELGSFRFQPSEFMKFSTALALGKYMDKPNFKLSRFKDQLAIGAIIGIPVVLIILQGDMGTALVFSVFIIVLFREGMPGWPLTFGLLSIVIFLLALLVENELYIWGGLAVLAIVTIWLGKKTFKRIALVVVLAFLAAGMFESVDYAFGNLLKPHQQNRILVLLNPNIDPLGVGWNITQSKIAIGSGGVGGKGFLNGTQTKFDFVPEQSTDFIFCTIGEEHGWIGSLLLIVMFITVLLRIIYIAERQKWRMVRVYGYSVAGIIFFHFTVNIGMTIGLFPVIGIPLPFFSYGGSSLVSFTLLLFILLKLDAHRSQRLMR